MPGPEDRRETARRARDGIEELAHETAKGVQKIGQGILDGIKTLGAIADDSLSPTQSQLKKANDAVKQSEEKLVDLYKDNNNYILANADRLFQQAHQPFDNFVASLPKGQLVNDNQLDYYLRQSLPARDYANPDPHFNDEQSYIEKVAQQQRNHIQAIREYAAKPTNAFRVAKTTLDGIYKHQRQHIEEYFDRAKLAIETNEPDAGNEDHRPRLLNELTQRRNETLQTFDQQKGEQLSSAQIDKQKEATEKEYLRALILSWQKDEMIQRLSQREAAGETSMLEDEELNLSQLDLNALREPIRTATGMKLEPDDNGGYALVTPGDMLRDIFYRRGSGHKPYADCLALAMLIRTQSDTMNFTIGQPPRISDPQKRNIGQPPRISDPQKRNKLVLQQAKRCYEAAIEAGFKPEDINITVTISEKNSLKQVVYTASSEQTNFQALFNDNRRPLKLVTKEATERRQVRLESTGIYEEGTALSSDTTRDFRNQSKSFRNNLLNKENQQLSGDNEIRQTQPRNPPR